MLPALLLCSTQVDRSGEAAFKATLNAVHSLEFRRVTAFNEGVSLQLDLGKGGAYRAMGADGWGDGILVVSDGKTVLVDPLSGSRPSVLRDANDDISTATNQFGKSSTYGGPFLQMRLGAGALERWVAPEAELKLAKPDEIVLQSKDFGAMRVVSERTTRLPLLIEYTSGQNTRTQQVYYEPLPKGVEKSFRVEVPKGPYTDLRQKKDDMVGTIKP